MCIHIVTYMVHGICALPSFSCNSYSCNSIFSHFSYYEQPTVQGLKEDNLGNKMLQVLHNNSVAFVWQ